jgi:hypothetical protein
MNLFGKRARRERAAGMAHRLWWLAAVMSIVVGLGIVLDTPRDSSSGRDEPTAVARGTGAGHGG